MTDKQSIVSIVKELNIDELLELDVAVGERIKYIRSALSKRSTKPMFEIDGREQILEFLAKTGGAVRGEIMSATLCGVSNKMDILDSLVRSGQVKVTGVKGAGAGRPKMVYTVAD